MLFAVRQKRLLVVEDIATGAGTPHREPVPTVQAPRGTTQRSFKPPQGPKWPFCVTDSLRPTHSWHMALYVSDGVSRPTLRTGERWDKAVASERLLAAWRGDESPAGDQGAKAQPPVDRIRGVTVRVPARCGGGTV
jgi:hypothetical protein